MGTRLKGLQICNHHYHLFKEHVTMIHLVVVFCDKVHHNCVVSVVRPCVLPIDEVTPHGIPEWRRTLPIILPRRKIIYILKTCIMNKPSEK